MSAATERAGCVYDRLSSPVMVSEQHITSRVSSHLLAYSIRVLPLPVVVVNIHINLKLARISALLRLFTLCYVYLLGNNSL